MTVTIPKSPVGAAIWVVTFFTTLFVMLLIQALAFRWSTTMFIDILSWWREVLNHLAGAVGA